jgi:hypothetical protein
MPQPAGTLVAFARPADLATDTGFELTSIPSLSRSPQLLVDCLLCGQDHPWEIGDAFLE